MNDKARPNPLAGGIVKSRGLVPKQQSHTMATEGNAGSIAKDFLKLVGLAVLGWGVGVIVGTLLNKIFFSRSRAETVRVKYTSLFSIPKVPERIERLKLVEGLERQHAHITYLLVECVNEGKLWTEACSLAEANWLKEKHNVLEATIQVDKLYSSKDEKTFVNRADALAKEFTGSAKWIMGELYPLAKVLKEAGSKFEFAYFFRGDTPEDIKAMIDDLRALSEAYTEMAGTQKDASFLSRKGDFALKHHFSDVEKLFKEVDSEDKSVNANVKEIERQNMDQEDIKAFLKLTPEITEANRKMLATIQLLAIATKIRGDIRTSVFHTLNTLAGGLHNTLRTEYKMVSSAAPQIGTESLFDEHTFEDYPVDINAPVTDSQQNMRLAENTLVTGILLDVATTALREAGVQAELGGDDASKFKDSDVVGLLAARFANTKKI